MFDPEYTMNFIELFIFLQKQRKFCNLCKDTKENAKEQEWQF